MEKIKRKLVKYHGLLLLIVFLALILRTLYLKENLFFGWEQGRDFLKFKEIVSGDPTLIGPKTDIDGFFHGALSYYIPIPFYLVFQGDPRNVLFSYIIINSAGLVFLYKFAEQAFSKRTAYLSTFFYAISYSSIIYSRWLSNPNLVPAVTIMFIYFLFKSKNSWKYMVLAAICWFVIFHLIIIVALSLVVPTIIYIYLDKIKITFRKIVSIMGVSVVMLSSYMIFEARNNFLMTRSLLTDDRSHGNFLVSNLGFLDQFFHEIVDSIFPISPRVGFVIFIFILVAAIKSKNQTIEFITVLCFLFAMPFMFIFISDPPLRHFLITVPIFLCLLMGYVGDYLLAKKNRKLAYIFILTITLGNLISIKAWLPESKGNFIHHAQRTYLSDTLNLVDYAYSDSDGTSFTYDYYSMPYWKEDAWIYIFGWYGKNKYGYSPAIDRTNLDRSEYFYTFIEPNESVKVHQDNWYGEYKKDSDLIDTYQSGHLKVEKRKIKPNTIH